jgi:hypothetical protein
MPPIFQYEGIKIMQIALEIHCKSISADNLEHVQSIVQMRPIIFFSQNEAQK